MDVEVTVEVTVLVLPFSAGAAPATPTPEELGWPSGFFEATEGALRDDPLERLPQGNYEEREELDPSG